MINLVLTEKYLIESFNKSIFLSFDKKYSFSIFKNLKIGVLGFNEQK